MNTPEVSIEEQCEAFKAWKRGGLIQYWSHSSKEWLTSSIMEGLTGIGSNATIRRKPTPLPRPWTQSEFPLNAWFRRKGCPHSLFRCDAVALSPSPCDVKARIDGSWFTALGMQQGLEWSADGREWANCEVVA